MSQDNQLERLKVYVAGPYKGGGTWGENLNNAIHAAERVLNAGHVPFIPHTHTALWDLVSPKSSEVWLDIDYVWLDQCDALVRLDGQSAGADAEVEYAQENGIPVYQSVEALVNDAGYGRTGGD